MKKKLIEIEVFDCGTDGHAHVNEGKARLCINATIKRCNKDLNAVNGLLRYLIIRVHFKVILEEFNIGDAAFRGRSSRMLQQIVEETPDFNPKHCLLSRIVYKPEPWVKVIKHKQIKLELMLVKLEELKD